MIDTGSIGRLADGTAAWLLTYAIHGTVLFGAAWLASRAKVGEQVRETMWKLALVGALLTTSVAQMRPGAPAVRIAPSTSIDIAESARPAADAPAVLAATAAAFPPVDDAAARPYAPVPWTRVLVLIWLVGAVVALTRLTAGWMRFTRQLARVPAADDPAAVALREICDAAGVRRRIRLSFSRGLAAPVALPGGEICIPRGMVSRLDAEQQRAMLAHETAHVLRRDPLWLWAASAMAAVFWFQPLLRACLRGLRDAAEYQCDAWAAGRTGAFALARCLADVAAWSSPRHTPAPAAAMAAGATLVCRVERLLHGAREPRARRRWTVAGVLAVALAAAYVPAISTEPAAAQRPAQRTPQQQTFATRFRIDPGLAAAIERAARSERVDPELAFRLVYTESRFDERKLGPGGVGLTQIILPTARTLQPGITREQLLQRDTNLRLGLRYLHRMLVRYDGNAVRAVQAYYQGPRQLDRSGANAETRAYADQLLAPVAGLPAYRGPGLHRS